MRAWILAAAGAAAFASLPAHADRQRYYWGPSFSVSYGYPYYGFYRPYPWYGWGPSYGIGVHVGPRYPLRRARTERAAPAEQRALKLYVYPAAGQSEEQTAEDRYQCHVWAADASDYDPTLGARRREDAESYTRAFTACMEGRDYVVK